MKKILLALSLFSALSLTACEKVATPAEEEQKQENNENDGNGNNNGGTPSGNNDNTGKKVLVAYFSFTNTTKGFATTIAEIAGADVYEIVPEVAYGSENSNYYDESTRAYKDITWGSGRKLNGSSALSEDELKAWVNSNL